MATKRLFRSRKDRVLAGVCGGLGEYFDIDPIIFRLLFVVLVIMGGSGVLLYILCWILIPEEASTAKEKDGETEVESRVQSVASDVKEALEKNDRNGPRVIIGILLLVMGALFLIQNLTGVNVAQVFWPLVIIAIGLGLILKQPRKDNV